MRIGILLLMLAASCGSASAQVSPGPLSKSHQFLSGASNCTSCHRLTGQAVFRCVECHTEIGTRIAAGRGFHAAVAKKDAVTTACRTCHVEHYGAEVPLIKWQPAQAQFDHTRTGWPLVGVHAKQACRKCHSPEHVPAEARAKLQVKDANRSFLGLDRNCSTCHKEPHQGKLGTDCQSCHAPQDWKPISKFDHGKTRFALTGEHLKLACEKCHLPSGPEHKPNWTGLKFAGCESCHKSPHPTNFSKSSCQACHNTAGFKSGSTTSARAHFDHASTKFPLTGKHAQLDCEKCHAGGMFGKPIAHQRCADCHKPSPHGTQFANRADGGECSACHSVEGFKPAKFGIEQHALTQFALAGKHTNLECSKCHAPAGAQTIYRLKFANCSDCHQDRHNGQLKSAPYLNRCQICHSVNDFRPSIFTTQLHINTRYPLLGAHAKLACAKCHRKPGVAGEQDSIIFHFPDLDCTVCHRDPHRGEFIEAMAKLDKQGKRVGCEACHTLDSWKSVPRFDHSSTEFMLVGRHRSVACADCHKPVATDTTLANITFRAATRCESCHTDVHGGQFASGTQAIPCSTCHNSFRWSPSNFDHDTQSVYKLEGQHRSVACRQCHTTKRTIAGRETPIYKPTPTQCEACHHNGKIRPLATS